MSDNNTYVLFEEIKNKLETIYRELKELKKRKTALFPSLFNLHQHKVMSRRNRNCSISMNNEQKK